MADVRSIDGVDFSGKKVLLRADFNVGIDEDGNVLERFKIESAKEALLKILSFPGAKVAVLSHFGRPEGKRDESFSLRAILKTAEESLGTPLVFVDDCVGAPVTEALASVPEGHALLLENVRFHQGEEADDEAFARELAAPFDIFVNDAFGVCHRNQASVSTIAKLLPSYAGPRLLKEITTLDAARKNPARPAVAVIGGAKIETKLPLLRQFEQIYDAVLVGGKIANEALDQKIVFSEKVLLPVDFQGGDARLDIGIQTMAMFAQVLQLAKTIVWNGPLGKFEESPYNAGTNSILRAMLDSGADIVIGGGESVAVLEQMGLIGKIGFVSTGGGAMLEYMSGKELPGIVALAKTTGVGDAEK